MQKEVISFILLEYDRYKKSLTLKKKNFTRSNSNIFVCSSSISNNAAFDQLKSLINFFNPNPRTV